MKKTLLIAILIVSIPAFAGFDWWLRVTPERAEELMLTFDALVAGKPGTVHYTGIEQSWMATEATVLMRVDEQAQSLVTTEEWAARLSEKPPEFVPPDPRHY